MKGSHVCASKSIPVLLAILAVLAVAGPLAAQDPIAYWRAEGNALDSVGGHHGTPLGGIGFTTGQIGQGFNLDGVDDGVEVPNTGGAFNLIGEWSLEAWVKPASPVAVGPILWKFDQNGQNGDTFALFWQSAFFWPYGTFGTHTERASNDQDFWLGAAPHETGSFYHVVGIYDDPLLRIYVNGALEGCENIGSINAYVGPAALRIGEDRNRSNRFFFHGVIDEVRVYDRPLSAAEVLAHFEAEKSPGMVAGTPSATCAAVDNDGLTTHYQFNNAASEAMLGFNSATGVNDPLAGSGVLTQVAGPGGSVPSGASFGATSEHRRINVGGGPLVGNGGVSAALRFRTTDALSSIRSLVFGGNSTGADDLFILELHQGRPRIFIRESGSLNDFALLHDTSLADDQWHCMAFTWSGGSVDSLSLYVDGLLSQQQSISRGFFSTTNWSVGSRYANGTTSFSYGGALADVRIYNHALSEDEIASLCGPDNQSPDCSLATIADQSADSSCQAIISEADVTGITDPDGDTLAITVDPTTLSLGPNTVTITADDGNGGSCSTAATVDVLDGTPPQFTSYPADASYQCASSVPPGHPSQASALDSCSTPAITVSDSSNGGAGSPSNPLVITRAFTATDAAGNSSSVEQTITVIDSTAPTVTLTDQQISLWPPNHNYVTVDLSQLVASASDNCGGDLTPSVLIAKVTSDEPEDANGNGNGNTLNDIVIDSACKSVQLRAEREGKGNGRIYTITFRVTDAAGNVATKAAKVEVRKSQGNNGAAVDDGPAYTINGTCL